MVELFQKLDSCLLAHAHLSMLHLRHGIVATTPNAGRCGTISTRKKTTLNIQMKPTKLQEGITPIFRSLSIQLRLLGLVFALDAIRHVSIFPFGKIFLRLKRSYTARAYAPVSLPSPN